MQMNIEHNSGSSEMLDLLQSVKEIHAVSAKDSFKGDPEVCMRATGKSAAELVAPVWDILLEGAADTAHPDVCFAIFNSLFNTVTSLHPAILENFFVAVIPVSSDRTPRATGTPAGDDTPSAQGDMSSATPGIKIRASSTAERFFKLLRSIGKKFCKSKGIHTYALSALAALLELLKLPTGWPLARLCHKLRLVDPTLSELADAHGASHATSSSSLPAFEYGGGAFGGGAFGGGDDEEEENGDEEGEGQDEEDVNAHRVLTPASNAHTTSHFALGWQRRRGSVPPPPDADAREGEASHDARTGHSCHAFWSCCRYAPAQSARFSSQRTSRHFGSARRL